MPEKIKFVECLDCQNLAVKSTQQWVIEFRLDMRDYIEYNAEITYPDSEKRLRVFKLSNAKRKDSENQIWNCMTVCTLKTLHKYNSPVPSL